MWTKASHKYQTRFGFVRKTNAYLSAEQINKHRQALHVENDLYNYALSYLNKMFDNPVALVIGRIEQN